MLIRGDHTPMDHQKQDVELLAGHCRVNIWNGLGTGKMNTGAWLALRWFLDGMIDECVVVIPSMCAPDWIETFSHTAFPEGLAEVFDCRPPDAGMIKSVLTSKTIPPIGRLRVMITSYSGLRQIMDARSPGVTRYTIDEECELLQSVRGRKVLVIFDESQAAALKSQQGRACQAFSRAARAVQSMSATPIGNPLQGRLWGMTRLVRPDILDRVPSFRYYGQDFNDVSSFDAFKARYYFLHDPTQQERQRRADMRRTGKRVNPIAAKSYPVSVNGDLMQAEIMAPMAPFTVQRRKEDCLDLPEKVYFRRSYVMEPRVRQILDDLVEDDRATLNDGRVVVVDNVLEERLRTLELCGGFLAGEPVHDGKFNLLSSVLDQVADDIGKYEPVLVWAPRTRELVASALVAAGVKPMEAMHQACACLEMTADNEWKLVQREYSAAVRTCLSAGVGLIHGPTPERERDRIQAEWKAKRLRVVCAHPGVAGAGLNWQHVRYTIFFSPPLGTIARSQSEDRVHRKNLMHLALYADLVTEGGPDEAVYLAHRKQRDAATALLDWMRGVSDSYR